MRCFPLTRRSLQRILANQEIQTRSNGKFKNPKRPKLIEITPQNLFQCTCQYQVCTCRICSGIAGIFDEIFLRRISLLGSTIWIISLCYFYIAKWNDFTRTQVGKATYVHISLHCVSAHKCYANQSFDWASALQTKKLRQELGYSWMWLERKRTLLYSEKKSMPVLESSSGHCTRMM